MFLRSLRRDDPSEHPADGAWFMRRTCARQLRTASPGSRCRSIASRAPSHGNGKPSRRCSRSAWRRTLRTAGRVKRTRR